jgi:sucrose-6-phosphate hydrolase SacC (GH32 family)
MRHLRSIFLILPILFILLTLFAQDGDAASPTRTAGGDGGTRYDRACGENEVMVGLSGKAGQWLDGMAPWCVPLSQNGRWQGAPHRLASTGGDPGWPAKPFQSICPANFAIGGFSGKEGRYLDLLTIECRALGSDGKLTGPMTPMLAGGTGGGTAFNPIRCADNQPATGAYGKSGIYVDSFGLKCTPESIWRPVFHFSPKTGWMNDPAGLVFLNGQYHLHYQAIPDDVSFDAGKMTWGHATSANLVDWTRMPPALSVGSNPLAHAPFTGSAVALTGAAASAPPCSCGAAQCILVIFTRSLIPIGNQYQALSPSCDNGRTYAALREQKIIERPWNSTPYERINFRDPKVFRYQASSGQGYWVMALAAGTDVKFFRSSDLVSWAPLSQLRIYTVEQLTGPFVETPDLVPLTVQGSTEQKWALLFAEGYLPTLVCGTVPPNILGGTEIRKACEQPAILGNYSKSLYLIGDFDGTRFVPDPPAPQPGGPWRSFARLLDAGPDFYAPQTWVVPTTPQLAAPPSSPTFVVPQTGVVQTTPRLSLPTAPTGIQPRGLEEKQASQKSAPEEVPDQEIASRAIPVASTAKYILAGWQSNWRYAHALPTMTWRGHLAIPRELSLIKQGTDCFLIQRPVAQLEAKRSPSFQGHVRNVPITTGLNIPVPTWRSTHYEAVMTLDVGSASAISVHVRARGSEQGATIGWRREASIGLPRGGDLRSVQPGSIVANSVDGTLFLRRSAQSFDAGGSAPAGYNGEWPVAFDGRTKASLPLSNGKLTLRLLVDRSSVEAFAGDGRVVLSAVMFPDSDNLEFQIASGSGTATLEALDLYEITD